MKSNVYRLMANFKVFVWKSVFLTEIHCHVERKQVSTYIGKNSIKHNHLELFSQKITHINIAVITVIGIMNNLVG